MSAYIRELQRGVERQRAQADRERAEAQRVATVAARERLTPPQERLSRLLASIPRELQSEGLSLSALQASLRERWRGNVHPGS